MNVLSAVYPLKDLTIYIVNVEFKYVKGKYSNVLFKMFIKFLFFCLNEFLEHKEYNDEQNLPFHHTTLLIRFEGYFLNSFFFYQFLSNKRIQF